MVEVEDGRRQEESLGPCCAAIRAASLTRPHQGRPACLYATPCTRGCSIGATFQSPNVLLAPALETGRLTVRADAVVRRIVTDDNGKAVGVEFVDRGDGQIY